MTKRHGQTLDTVSEYLDKAEIALENVEAQLAQRPKFRERLNWIMEMRAHLWQAHTALWPIRATFGRVQREASRAEKRYAWVMSLEHLALQRRVNREARQLRERLRKEKR